MIQSSNDRAEGDKLSTTKLYVEYIIIGMETLGWILLILIAILKNEMLNFLDYCIKNITSTIIIVIWRFLMYMEIRKLDHIVCFLI